MTTATEAAQIIADHLIGSACHGPSYTLEGALEQFELSHFAEDKQFLASFDMLCFLCDDCGWWCSTEELHNLDGVTEKCDDCTDENEDDD